MKSESNKIIIKKKSVDAESCPGHPLSCVIDRSVVCLFELRGLHLPDCRVVMIMKFSKNRKHTNKLFEVKRDAYTQCALQPDYKTNWTS